MHKEQLEKLNNQTFGVPGFEYDLGKLVSDMKKLDYNINSPATSSLVSRIESILYRVNQLRVECELRDPYSTD